MTTTIDQSVLGVEGLWVLGGAIRSTAVVDWRKPRGNDRKWEMWLKQELTLVLKVQYAHPLTCLSRVEERGVEPRTIA